MLADLPAWALPPLVIGGVAIGASIAVLMRRLVQWNERYWGDDKQMTQVQSQTRGGRTQTQTQTQGPEGASHTQTDTAEGPTESTPPPAG